MHLFCKDWAFAGVVILIHDQQGPRNLCKRACLDLGLQSKHTCSLAKRLDRAVRNTARPNNTKILLPAIEMRNLMSLLRAFADEGRFAPLCTFAPSPLDLVL